MILAHQTACDNKSPLHSPQQTPSRMQKTDQQHHIKQDQGSAGPAEDDHQFQQQQPYRTMAPTYQNHQLAPLMNHQPTLISQQRYPHHQQRQRAYSSGYPITSDTPTMYSTFPPQQPHPDVTPVPSGSAGQEGYLMPPSYFSASHSSKPLAVHALLQAPTAITPKTDDATVTYLNRGQWYVIELTDQQKHLEPISSTVSIMFHNAAHRRVASNYWKFWLNQQKDLNRARAIDLDSVQSVGIQNAQFTDFDRVTFDWNTNARIYVRFNCLSTDFSRIKGVKGIPLRVQLESEMTEHQHQQQCPIAVEERSFCKIKLFRDKGAERKSKDDAKQMGKQFERIPGGHLWLMYTQPLPYSIFTADIHGREQGEGRLAPQQQQVEPVPAAALRPPPILADHPIMTSTRHARTMTAPPTYPTWQPSGHHRHQHHQHWPSLMQTSPPDFVLSYGAVASSPPPPPPPPPLLLSSLTPPAAVTNRKRIRQDRDDDDNNNSSSSSGSGSTLSHVSLSLSGYKRREIEGALYVQTSSGEARRIDLQEWTVQELKEKLCDFLSVYSKRVSDIVWRRRDETSAEFLILVDDAVIAHHLSSGQTVTVYYEPMQDGSGRLVLQQD